MSQTLPAKPSLVFLRKQAKDLLESLRSGDPETVQTVARYFPSTQKVGLIRAQLVLAREYGFDSWAALREHVASLDAPAVEAFVDAVLRGRLDTAQTCWQNHRKELRLNLVAASMAGDLDAVTELVAVQPENINAPLPPKDRPLLCYVCFSRLASDAAYEPGVVNVVSHLLNSGADANSVYVADWGGETWRETALYGAAGVLNHAGITKLLLDAGADPDDGSVEGGTYRGESLYHACDHPGHNECLRLILEANPSQVAKDYCIHRKLDFEDVAGVRLFLAHGTNPNANRPRTALSQAILRGRSLRMQQLLLDAGADPNQPNEDGTTAYVLARRLANKEASALLEAHGATQEFRPHDALLIAAADGDIELVHKLAEENPDILSAFGDLGRQPESGLSLGSAGQILHDLARLGHVGALRALLDLGLDQGLRNQYDETPLHWACVAGRSEAAKLLVERGAPLDVREKGHNCVPIEWAYWGSLYWNEPSGDYARTVEVVLDAGMPLPERLEGSPEVLAVLHSRGAR